MQKNSIRKHSTPTTAVRDMTDEELKELFVTTQTSYAEANETVKSLLEERNTQARELMARDINIAGGFRIRLAVEWKAPKDWKDSETPRIEALDKEIEELETKLKDKKKERKALAEIQTARAQREDKAVAAKTVISVEDIS